MMSTYARSTLFFVSLFLAVPSFADCWTGSISTKVSRIATSGNLVLVAFGSNADWVKTGLKGGGLQIARRISDTQLDIIGSFSTEVADSIAVYGNYVYLGTGTTGQGILVIDISDPTKPIKVGSYPMPSVFDIAFKDGYILAVTYAGGGGLVVVNVADPTMPARESSANIPHRGYISVSGDVSVHAPLS